MKQFLKYIYRIIYGVLLRKNKVYVSYSTLFNTQNQWGGYNKVGNKTVISSSSIGKYSFVGSNGYLPNVSIGNFCSIGNNVHVVAETHPSKGFISTSPVFYSLNKQCGTTFVKEQLFTERLSINGRSCIIGNDVWIGTGAIILGNIKIGNGAVVAAGTVVTASYGYNGGYGNYIVISHGNGVQTAYGHCNSLSVSVGQKVSQGQLIGTVGNTGNSTGNHLHLEIRVNGVAQNPQNYLY